MITLQFSLQETNQLLSLLGQLPFAASNGIIQEIVQQAQPQATVKDQIQQQAGAKVAEAK